MDMPNYPDMPPIKYCDACKLELFAYVCCSIDVRPNNSYPNKSYDMCLTCTQKVLKQLDPNYLKGMENRIYGRHRV